MINRISIQHFKSLDNICIDLTNNSNEIICLLGKNGSGKTNILKAIAYYFKYIGRLFSEENIVDGNNPYIQKCVISISFNLSLLSAKAKQNEQLNKRFERIRHFIIQMTDNVWMETEKIELTMTQFRDGTIKWNIEDSEICKTIKATFPLYYIDTRQLDLYTWDKLWQIISDLSSSKSNSDYTAILDKAFSEIYGKKYNSSRDIIEKVFDECNVSFDKFNFEERYKSAFSMRFGGNRFVVDGHSLDYYSDGSSSFTYLKILIALIPQISDISCKFPIILLDEPEIGLHNEFISEIVEALNSNIKKRAFCMLSTHSPKLIVDLNNKNANYAIYRVTKKGLYSFISRMNTSWITNSKHKVTVRETECYFYDYLVYVEGETEVQLFSHPKILELFNKLKKVHFYSFDSNDQRLKTVLSDNLNLGVPYKLIVDMDKILQYNKKGKFNLSSTQTVNPFSNTRIQDKEHYAFFNTKKAVNNSAIRAIIDKLIKKNYSLLPNKNYVDDNDFNRLMYSIISYCNYYDVIVNWSTIEGTVITYENIDDFIDFIDKKGIKHTNQHTAYCSEKDIREKTILVLSEYNGKNEIFKCARYNNKSVSKAIDKTEGWISEWIDYYFKLRIDSLTDETDRKKRFKNDFPQLYNTLQIIENML